MENYSLIYKSALNKRIPHFSACSFPNELPPRDKDRLYTMEVFVKGIRLCPIVTEVPEKCKIGLHISFRNFVNVNVQTESFNAFCNTKPELSRYEMKLDIWSSQEFRCKAEDLLMALDAEPLMLCFMKQWDPVPFGISHVPWTLNFMSMVEKSRSPFKQIPAAESRGEYELFSKSTGQLLGEVDVMVRLSSSLDNEII